MRVIVSAAVSLDGCLDDCSKERLILSSPEDWSDVYLLRSQCDAIIVGAGTLRLDNPSLKVKGEDLIAQRELCGQNKYPARVTISQNGNLDVSLNFFAPDAEKIVFVSSSTPKPKVEELQRVSEVVLVDTIDAKTILSELCLRGYNTILVEGGSKTLTSFFAENMVDELRLAIAPFFVGDSAAPKLVGFGSFPYNKTNRARVRDVRLLGDVTVTRYGLERSDVEPDFAKYAIDQQDNTNLLKAISVSRNCLPGPTCYRVGAVIVANSGEIFSGYTHESTADNHAEEEAINKAVLANVSLAGATIYTSMEPCSTRKSKALSCSQLIINHQFSRVVFACREPDCFVTCNGVEMLRKSGIEVVELPYLAYQVECINSHIIR